MARPKLTVIVVVEQLRADALETHWQQFGSGGFRRIAEKGAWFAECRHLSSTFSATGIANLATGAWPAQHGIVADRWYDPAAKTPVSASDESLLATSLAAQAADDAGMRVQVVAMTRMHAALFAATPNARLFFHDERGEFTASTAAPDWLREFNAAHGPEGARDANWMAMHAVAGAPPLRTLRYDANRPAEFLALYRASPFSQTALFDLGAELVVRDQLGQGPANDLLCLVDGSSALLGYEAGARSPLVRQMVLQLDRRLENLQNALIKAVGETGFTLAVCAAHGAPPEPSAAARPRMAVNGEKLAQQVEAVLSERARHVEKYIYPFLYLDHSGTAVINENLRRLAAQAAMADPALAGYYTAGGICSMPNDWQIRFQNSFHSRRSGDVMFSYRPEYVEDFGAGRGISYGSLYNYDVRVPLLLMGPQFRPGVYENPVDAVDVAPTLARAMGIAQPSSTTGRVLSEALLP